jgi:hypothetical protein
VAAAFCFSAVPQSRLALEIAVFPKPSAHRFPRLIRTTAAAPGFARFNSTIDPKTRFVKHALPLAARRGLRPWIYLPPF